MLFTDDPASTKDAAACTLVKLFVSIAIIWIFRWPDPKWQHGQEQSSFSGQPGDGDDGGDGDGDNKLEFSFLLELLYI